MSTPVRSSPRERLLAAADALFYDEGINTVGIDRVIARAGVAKASLYDSFGSKEELVRSYLAGRHEARRARILRVLAEHHDAEDKLLAVFDLLGEIFADPGFRGCAFVNASAEARPEGAVAAEIEAFRKWLRSVLLELAGEIGSGAPQLLADQLLVLHDGATVGARLDRDPARAAVAQAIAKKLIADAKAPHEASRAAAPRGRRKGPCR